jgi:hypothetical protein
MTVLEKNAANGVDWQGLARYFTVAVLAVAVGAGAALGVHRVVRAERLGPAEIEQARGALLGELLRNQYTVEIVRTRAAERLRQRGPRSVHDLPQPFLRWIHQSHTWSDGRPFPDG